MRMVLTQKTNMGIQASLLSFPKLNLNLFACGLLSLSGLSGLLGLSGHLGY